VDSESCAEDEVQRRRRITQLQVTQHTDPTSRSVRTEISSATSSAIPPIGYSPDVVAFAWTAPLLGRATQRSARGNLRHCSIFRFFCVPFIYEMNVAH
jgi:hypothetical protein